MPRKNPYETLEVDKNATPEEIKKAYRKKSQKSHPDKQGGEIGAFLAVQHAFRILGNKDFRSHYDKTGQEPDEMADGLEGRIKSEVAGMVYRIISQLKEEDLAHCDMIKSLLQAVSNAIKKLEKERDTIKKDIIKHRNIAKRFKRVKGKKKPNLIKIMVEGRAKEMERILDENQKKIDFHKGMIEFIQDYGYDQDVMQTIGYFNVSMGTAGTSAY